MRKVLIVDDEPAVLQLLSVTLGRHYQVLKATNARAAHRLAMEQNPDAICLDILMPRMNGIKLCRMLKRNPATSHIKIIMVSAVSEDSMMRRARRAGADDYCVKPFSPTALLEKLRRLVADDERV